jgi:predicted Zn-dependent protease
MATLNVEPGESRFDELIGGVERGVFMRTNKSWSIDDSRNKFQFGCEVGQLIEDGELKGLVKNPNYRGISATFWRSLSGVGDASTVEVLGTPFCGKGEPNQIIRVGHASATSTLSGRQSDDAAMLRASLSELREIVAALPDDPHLLYCTEPRESTVIEPDELPDASDAVRTVLELGAGHDLVGHFASGALHRGFASSLGHRLWHTSHSFHLDFSLYAERDKAAKSLYAGTQFSPSALEGKIGEAARRVEILRRPERRIDPGSYRVFLTPSALTEILGLLAYSSFGVKSHRTKQTALLRMLDGGAALHPRVSLTEDAATGVAPRFSASGFARPERVELVTRGRLAGALISPRSAKEYGLSPNSGKTERPSALSMAPGDLLERDVLGRLGTGIYVTDTWYTNYSDLASARITGMTRFATTWVEDGEPVAPLAVMRFDDSVYRMLGSELEALTAEREWMLDGGTYFERSTDSYLLPGALLSSMTFTL